MAANDFGPFSSLPKAGQWSVLAVLSVILATLLELARLPAALMLGPMIAAIMLAVGGGKVAVPKWLFQAAQAVIGCMVARIITGDIVWRFLRQWPLFVGLALVVIAMSCVLGVVLSKWKVLPDTTAIWGLLPGAASVMMLMAGEFGADARLVAFMQYLRVLVVATTASLVARVWLHVSGSTVPVLWFPAIHGVGFGETLALVLAGVLLGRRMRIPAAPFLLPMVLGSFLQGEGYIHLELPPWLLATSYLLLGWTVGLRFTREILNHAMHALPQTFLAILAMIIFCAGLAWVVVRVTGVDPLTAYLATSPGGADTAAIIAASSQADMAFVMTLQLVRFLLIMMIGPLISRWLVRRFFVATGPVEPQAGKSIATKE